MAFCCRYLTPFDQVRFGRLLEDLDTFAVACCYKHNENPALPVSTLGNPPDQIVDSKKLRLDECINKYILLARFEGYRGIY